MRTSCLYGTFTPIESLRKDRRAVQARLELADTEEYEVPAGMCFCAGKPLYGESRVVVCRVRGKGFLVYYFCHCGRLYSKSFDRESSYVTEHVDE